MATFPTYSALDFIERALILIGVLQPGETADAENAEDAFATLQEWIDGLGIQRLAIYQLLRTVKTLASSTASYTIGTGGNINIVRPEWIEHARLILDTGAATPTEVGLRVLTDDEWAALAQKTLASSLATSVYYDHAWAAGLGRIYVYPIPNVGTTQLVLYTPLALTTFADLSTGYTFPPGYPRAIRTNLAMELCADFGKTPPDALRQQASESLALIKRKNTRLSVVTLDPSLPGSARGGMTGSRFLGGNF